MPSGFSWKYQHKRGQALTQTAGRMTAGPAAAVAGRLGGARCRQPHAPASRSVAYTGRLPDTLRGRAGTPPGRRGSDRGGVNLRGSHTDRRSLAAVLRRAGERPPATPPRRPALRRQRHPRPQVRSHSSPGARSHRRDRNHRRHGPRPRQLHHRPQRRPRSGRPGHRCHSRGRHRPGRGHRPARTGQPATRPAPARSGTIQSNGSGPGGDGSLRTIALRAGRGTFSPAGGFVRARCAPRGRLAGCRQVRGAASRSGSRRHWPRDQCPV